MLIKNNWKTVMELVGAFAIVASLIFVALELRQNSRATLSASFQAATDSINQINLTAGTDDDLVRIYAAGFDSLNDLSAEDRIRVSYFLLALTRIRETIYYQQDQGTTAEQSWLREEESLRNNFRSQSFREWWTLAKQSFGFAPEFREYADSIMAEVEASL